MTMKSLIALEMSSLIEDLDVSSKFNKVFSIDFSNTNGCLKNYISSSNDFMPKMLFCSIFESFESRLV